MDGLKHAARAGRSSWVKRLHRTARRRPLVATGGALAALAVLLVPVTALSETPQGCTDAASLDLCQFYAGEPAVAAEVNSNFTKLLGWLQDKVGAVDDPDNITTGGTVSATSVSATTVASDTVDANIVGATGLAVGGDGLAVNGPVTVDSDNSLVVLTMIEMGTTAAMNAGGWDTGIPTADWNCFVGGLQMLHGDIQEDDVGDILFAYTYVEGTTWRLRADFRSHNTHETHTIGLVCVRTGVSRRDAWFSPH